MDSGLPHTGHVIPLSLLPALSCTSTMGRHLPLLHRYRTNTICPQEQNLFCMTVSLFIKSNIPVKEKGQRDIALACPQASDARSGVSERIAAEPDHPAYDAERIKLVAVDFHGDICLIIRMQKHAVVFLFHPLQIDGVLKTNG